MMDAEQSELLAVRSEFCTVVASWRLTQAEIARLLSLQEDAKDRVIPDVLDASAETKLRLIVRLARGLSTLMPDDVDVAAWLREGALAYGGVSPLVTFTDLAELRAVVRVLETGRWNDAMGTSGDDR